ncbi:TetR/AcrR family transcriptional regulator [Paenibacillus chitinolyticus]|uniref:TetR/AcrR family transcriptional regulator n=1 Tax=Paenibacillus chitinolyticus TaxID=79263 RepID=UPI00365C691E
MARQRAFTKSELLDATERLLMERGYDGFHLKALSEMLSGARSTIYEYYANKEEIVAACMRRTMEQTIEACEGIEQLEPVAAIKKVLLIFLELSNFHTLMLAAPKIDETASDKARRDLEFLNEGHADLKKKLTALFQKAQEAGALRADIPLPVITAVFFHAIDTPNWLNVPTEEWADMLFGLWWNGGGNPLTT